MAQFRNWTEGEDRKLAQADLPSPGIAPEEFERKAKELGIDRNVVAIKNRYYLHRQALDIYHAHYATDDKRQRDTIEEMALLLIELADRITSLEQTVRGPSDNGVPHLSPADQLRLRRVSRA